MRTHVPLRMRREFTTRQRGGASAIVRRDFASTFDRLQLIEAADGTATEILSRAARLLGSAAEGTGESGGGAAGSGEGRSAGPDAVDAPRLLRPGAGRGELTLLPTGSGPGAVVRPYRRGGLPAHVSERRYMLGHRAFRELIVTERLLRARAPVPTPLAAVQSRATLGYRAALVTLYLPRAEPAPDLLDGREPAECRPVLRSMGRGAGRLHGAGGWHADLNAGNFLVPRDARRGTPRPGDGGDADGDGAVDPASGPPPGPATILDLDRGRMLSSPLPHLLARWNLRRLRRSLRKLELHAALEAWEAFEEGYELGRDEG